MTKSRLLPVILTEPLPVVTVYLYSPMFASLVLKLCIRARDARPDAKADAGIVGLSSDAEEFTLELEPVSGPPTTPPTPIPCSRTGEAFLLIVSSISCFA